MIERSSRRPLLNESAEEISSRVHTWRARRTYREAVAGITMWMYGNMARGRDEKLRPASSWRSPPVLLKRR